MSNLCLGDLFFDEELKYQCNWTGKIVTPITTVVGKCPACGNELVPEYDPTIIIALNSIPELKAEIKRLRSILERL